jgi:DNA replication protein DnaC
MCSFLSRNKAEITDLLQEGLHFFQHAVKEDNLQNYKEAHSAYSQGAYYVNYLLQTNKKKLNKKEQLKIRKYTWPFMRRAQILKCYLETNKIPTMIKLNTQSFIDNENFEYQGYFTEQDREIILDFSTCIRKFPNKIDWETIVGQNDAKEEFKITFEWSAEHPNIFKTDTPSDGVILYGPPGTGKTKLAECVASRCPHITFFNVDKAKLLSKFIGESERKVYILFQMASQRSPSIIFIGKIF